VITGDDRWFQVCTRISDAVFAELDGTKPCRAGVVPGLVAWDDCSCGLLAVTWSITMASETFPQEKVDITGNCDAPWEVMEAVVQLIRCAPSPPGNNSKQLAPSVRALSDAALRMDKDESQTVRACSVLLCGMKDVNEISDFMVGRCASLGPEGGCVGIELRMYVALPRLTART
jgi:hypothetical protein